MAGLAVLVAQQVAFVVTTYLANHRGDAGSIAVYTWANAVYLLPYAVLAVPITTAVFPRLAAAFELVTLLPSTCTPQPRPGR